MGLTRTDVVLHPVRSRIVRSFLGTERRTAGELTRLLPDVPQASLYRHLNALIDGKILRVISPGEQRIPGSGRRGYALVASADLAGNRAETVYLDDAEFAELNQHLAALFDRAAAHPPAPGRRRRLLATLAVPLDEQLPNLP